jgi:acyl dehydratase
MGLDHNATGHETDSFEFEYTWKAAVLYALGIGATREELDYLYEGRGPKVYPTFAVTAAYAPVQKLIEELGIDLKAMVHGSQTVTVHAPLPPEGRLQTVARVSGIYDMKRMAQVVITATTRSNGDVCCETEWSLLALSEGGFGGAAPPKGERFTVPDGAQADWGHDQPTTNEQALLYRLSGDLNPLHADPEFAREAGFPQGPILHGMCTFGIIARAVILRACSGSAERLRAVSAQFRRPMWPGETLRTEGYRLADGRYAIRAFSAGRGEPVVGACWALTR